MLTKKVSRLFFYYNLKLFKNLPQVWHKVLAMNVSIPCRLMSPEKNCDISSVISRNC